MTIHKGGVISKNHNNDELYTPQELSNQIAEFYYKKLSDYETILMPFNSKGSKLEKALFEKGLNVISTSGDFFELDLNKYKNTVVFDNPPFSVFGKILKRLNEFEMPYYLFGPSMSLFNHLRRDYVTGFNQLGRILFDNSETKVNVGIYTNCDFYLRNTFKLVNNAKIVDLENIRYGTGKIVPRLENGQVFDSRDFHEYSNEGFGGSMIYKGEINMTEEVEVLLPKVQFQPAKFEITNWEEVMKRIDFIIETRSDLVVTEDNEDESNEVRKELDNMVEKFSRARIDTEKEILKNFDPKKVELMKQEKRMKNASNHIKEQIKVFKEKRAAEKAQERRNKINKIIESKCNENEVDPLKIVWDEKWTKNETYKNIEASIDAQIANLNAAKREKEVMKEAIVQIAEAIGLQPQVYIDMIGIVSFEEIKQSMNRAAAEIKKQEETQRLAEEAKSVVEEDVILDPKELQREVEEEKKAENENMPSETLVDKPVETVENSNDDEPTKQKYLFMPEVKASQWEYIKNVVSMLNENGVKTVFIEPENK